MKKNPNGSCKDRMLGVIREILIGHGELNIRCEWEILIGHGGLDVRQVREVLIGYRGLNIRHEK